MSGVVAPKFDDDETTVAQLKQRIARTHDFVLAVLAEQIDGSHVKVIEVPMHGRSSLTFSGGASLKHKVLPSFCLHLTTTCPLLPHNGAPLAKIDDLGRD
ncbi:MAG: DUF1993 family protein [Burkholderiales bacterium]